MFRSGSPTDRPVSRRFLAGVLGMPAFPGDARARRGEDRKGACVPRRKVWSRYSPALTTRDVIRVLAQPLTIPVTRSRSPRWSAGARPERAASSRWIRTPPRRRSAPRNPPARSSVSPRPSRSATARGSPCPSAPPPCPSPRANRPRRRARPVRRRARTRGQPPRSRTAAAPRRARDPWVCDPPSRRAVRVSRTSPDAFDEARRTRN